MNTRYILTLCTVLVIGGALITGSAHAVNNADKNTPITDTWMTAKTKIALFADARVKGSEINIETSQGSVIIRGKVDSDEAKQAAEEIAKGIDGVKTVKNELIFIAIMLSLLVGLMTLYLYNSGAFTKTAPKF